MKCITLFYGEIEAFGGEERLILAIMRHAHRLGLPHRLVCLDDRVGMASFAEWRLEVVRLQAGGNALTKTMALRKYWRRERPHLELIPLAVGLQMAVIGGFAGISDFDLRIADPPSLALPPPQTSAFRRLKTHLYQSQSHRGFARARKVITNARYLADELDKRYGVHSHVIYPGGKAPPEVAGPGTLPSARRSILSVCRLEESKRIDWIILAFEGLLRSGELSVFEGWRLDIVGEGAMRNRLEALVVALGLQNSVIFHGFVDDSALEKLYADAALFVMPAIQGFGLPALEAIQRCVPVALHLESGVSELLVSSIWAEVFRGGSDDLREAMRKLISRLSKGAFDGAAIEPLPTEESFAKEVFELCGWST